MHPRYPPPVTALPSPVMADPVALWMLYRRQQRRHLRRNRIFRDRTDPLDKFDDVELYTKFRFRRQDILQLVDEVENDLRPANRPGVSPLTASMQICLALRFYACGSFQDVVGETINVHQSTASRTIAAVTTVLRRHAGIWIRFPNSQREADREKEKFQAIAGFPHVLACVDGTHIEVTAPSDNEHEFVNRKGRHSINVMVMTNADLKFVDVSARWPGSVHDSRVLRESAIFQAFEGPARPVRGYILGDSGYMLRTWLLTPVLNPRNDQEQDYNNRHCSTRCTVERTIGIAKRRFHCLGKLRVKPAKACDIIVVCFMLHNRARALNLPDPDDGDDDGGEEAQPDAFDVQQLPAPANERLRAAAGKAERQRVINAGFNPN